MAPVSVKTGPRRASQKLNCVPGKVLLWMFVGEDHVVGSVDAGKETLQKEGKGR